MTWIPKGILLLLDQKKLDSFFILRRSRSKNADGRPSFSTLLVSPGSGGDPDAGPLLSLLPVDAVLRSALSGALDIDIFFIVGGAGRG